MCKLYLYITAFAFLMLSSCTQKHDFINVKIGHWYVSNDINVAIRFNNVVGGIYGEYIITDGCYSDLYRFECVVKRKTIKFIFKSHRDILLDGIVYSNKLNISVQASERDAYKFSLEKNTPFEGKQRYQKPLFDDVSVTEVIYGKAPGFYSSKQVPEATSDKYPQILADVLKSVSTNFMCEDIDLKMDIYQPIGDKVRNRPVILLIHGGAFIVGDKRDEFNVRLAKYYASCGYVVASINYRLGFIFIPGMYSELERAMYRATQDTRSALRFLSDNKNIYGINPEFCFVGGNSAGGFISLFACFMEEHEKMQSAVGNPFKLQSDLGCLDCSGNTNKSEYRIRRAVSMWGGINDLEIIDDYEKIPVLLIHGDADQIVPYNYDYPFSNVSAEMASVFTKKVYGSMPVYEKMQSLSFDAELFSLIGEGHEPFKDENQMYAENYDAIKNKILTFFTREMQNDDFVISRSNGNNKCLYNANSSGKVNWNAVGGVIISNKTDGVQVVWINNLRVKYITASEVDEMGCTNFFTLKSL